MRRSMVVHGATWLMLACATQAKSQQQWRLVEDLRIGGDESDATIFTDPRSVVVGPQGHLFVLDFRPQEIRVFDRGGKFVKTVSRKGQGPGELSNSNGLLLLADTIWANDPANGRWNAYSSIDGKYLRQITIPITMFGYVWDAGQDGRGQILDRILVPVARAAGSTGEPQLESRFRRVRTDGAIVDTVPEMACVQREKPAKTIFRGSNPGGMNMSIPFLPRPLAVFDGRGGSWCTPNDEYLLVHRAVGRADTLHAVRRAHTRIPVSDAERDSVIASAKTALARYSVVDADYSLIPKTRPVFVRLDRDDDGNVWARRTTRPGSGSQFDVYDSSGRMVATVSAPVVFREYIPLHIRGDHAYGFVTDEDDVPYVVRMRIVRAAGGR